MIRRSGNRQRKQAGAQASPAKRRKLQCCLTLIGLLLSFACIVDVEEVNQMRKQYGLILEANNYYFASAFRGSGTKDTNASAEDSELPNTIVQAPPPNNVVPIQPPPLSPSDGAQMENESAMVQSCADLAASTAAFASDVFQDAEGASLKAWRKGNWEIPTLSKDLLMSAFGGRRVVLVGDSTTAYTMHWINNLMNGTTPELLASLQQHTLTDGIQALKAWHKERNAPTDIIGHKYEDYNQAFILWLGYRGSSMHINCDFHKRQWPNVRKLKPEILLVNWGAHMLATKMIKTCNLYQWVHYEQWLEGALDVAHETGVKVLLFKTTNRICSQQPEDPVQECQGWVDEMDPLYKHNPPSMRNVSEADKKKYCQEGLLREDGAESLNARLVAYLPIAQKRYPSMKIALYNDHDLESCSQTLDGIHYTALQLPRIRLFAHMVNCLLD